MLGVFSEEEVFKLLCSGIMDAWVGHRGIEMDGFALCAWEVHARAKYYHVLHIMGSNLKLYMNEGLLKLEKWAYVMGAREVVVEGRLGWRRLLSKRGYSEPTVRLRKNMPKAWGN